MRTPFTIQGDDVYWNGQLVAKITVPVSTLRDVIEAHILAEHEDFRREEAYEEAYDAGYKDGRDDGRERISLND